MSKRYEILEQIGKGGLGAVYKALDTQLHREVAIKRVLSTDKATEEEVKEAAEKLIAEAQTLSSLNHPNIITVFDVGQDEEGGFVVMELLKGETLDETIERGVLTQEDFTEVVYQTMEALIAAQANDVIHRDIKPTNIMVIWQASGKFQLKILDFGLAKFSKTPSVQTMDQEESVMGSIFFMAPEQFERGELDARTDLYQMGCVYYNALTGQYPFNGETAPQVMNAHLQHRVIPLEQIRPDLSPSICQWVMWLINRDIAHRPQDAREALKHWPRDPAPPGATPVQALPVEATPEVATGAVTVVRVARRASAPPALIVPGGGSATGAITGRLRTGTGAIGGRGVGGTGPIGRGAGDRGSNLVESGKIKWILLGGIALLLGGFAAAKWIGGAGEGKRMARIAALASSETPTGDSADVALAVRFLADPKASPTAKSDAQEVLERLEGSGISESIHVQMRDAPGLPLKISLAQALAKRGYAPGVPDMIEVFKASTTDEQRVRTLSAVRELAGLKDMPALLGALHSEHSQPVRTAFEDTVLAVLRRGGETAGVVDSMLAKLSSSAGGERRSLFRILGSLGGEKVRARLAAVYGGNGDADYRRDAIIAYFNWPDRSVLDEVEAVIGATDDVALRDVAERAYVRLCILPGPEPVAEMVPLWRKAFGYVRKPDVARDLFDALLDHPYPETLALLREWQAHPNYGALAKSFGNTLDQQIKGIAEVKPGETMKGNRGRPRGRKAAKINSDSGSFTDWVSPDTWFTWQFKAAESGEFLVEIDQATELEPSDFVVHLAGTTLEGQSATTGSLEKFVPVRPAGTVSLEAGETYVLVVAAGRNIRPRMMDIAGVRYAKP